VNKKWVPYLLILTLAIILFFVKRGQQPAPVKPKNTTTTTNRDRDPAASPDRNRGFDRRVSYIEYTVHAKCRMQCRKISQAEVEEIMKGGVINYTKSDVNNRPCPTYALEGITSDEQKVRIVFAQCDLKTKVVTCIDLGTDWACDCSGDDQKSKRKN
jgi:Domain of unknown function (DUF4258)